MIPLKKIILCTGLVLLSMSSFAQTKNAIKFNYLSAAVLTLNAAYERAILPKTSLQLGGYYTSVKVQGTGYTGYGLTPEVRFYTGSDGLEGFFVAPFYRYQYFELTETLFGTRNKATFVMSGGGVVIGGKWETKNFCFDIFGGPVLKSGTYTQKAGTDEIDFRLNGNGVGFRFGSTIGFAF